MFEEATEGEPTRDRGRERARQGARRSPRTPQGRGRCVIGGDTEVVIDGSPLGQPEDEREARWCLEALSGRDHEVMGGLALLGPERDDDGFLERSRGVATRRAFRAARAVT